MLRAANGLIHTIKDQVRGVRYSLRAEAEVPGSALPKALRGHPLVAIGSMVGIPAVRLADDILTRVETIATEVLPGARGTASAFPCPVDRYLAAGPDGASLFVESLYEELKQLLRRHGVRTMLVSQQALDTAWASLRARHGDAVPAQPPGEAESRAWIGVCAGLACALADAKPIRKVQFEGDAAGKPHLMLSPNVYGALVIGLATAVVTRDPHLADDRDAVLDSADSVVDARFARFSAALTSRAPVEELTAHFLAVLPYLP